MGRLITGPFDRWCDAFVYLVKSDLCPVTEYGITMSYQLQEHTREKYIVFNTEQLTRKVKLEDALKWFKDPRVVEVWDYSLANIKILQEHGFSARHVPLKTPQAFLEKVMTWKKENEFSVGFCGSLSKRRLTILNALREHNIKVHVITEKWGDDRDRELAQNKVIVNIHYADDYKVYEQCRCNAWIDAGYIVVTENSLDNDNRCINVDYKDIVSTIVNISKMPTQ